MAISVLVVDQERTFADALAMRLEAEQDVEIVAAIRTKTPVQSPLVRGQADVMLLDGDFADGSAIRICTELSARDAAPQVIILSHSSEAERILAAIEAGAVGWVRKDSSLEYLLRVIRGVVNGEAWLPPAETRMVLRLLLHDRDQQRQNGQLLAGLTPREREVLACLAEGASRQDVAERLQLSAHTIRTHLQNLMAKLGVHSALEAVALTRSELAELNSGPDS
jgi:two-component system NarL family response regulator